MQTGSTEGEQEAGRELDAGAPQSGAFGGLGPSAAARRRWQLARERKAEAEREAEIDALTLSARTATAAAEALTRSRIAATLDRLAEDISTGTPSQAAAASREQRAWLALALQIPEGEDAALGLAPGDMSREQRAAHRAIAEAVLASRAGTEEGSLSVQPQPEPRDHLAPAPRSPRDSSARG